MKLTNDPPPIPSAPWVTEAFIEKTIAVWSRRSPTPLTRADAIEIILSAGRLIEILKAG